MTVRSNAHSVGSLRARAREIPAPGLWLGHKPTTDTAPRKTGSLQVGQLTACDDYDYDLPQAASIHLSYRTKNTKVFLTPLDPPMAMEIHSHCVFEVQSDAKQQQSALMDQKQASEQSRKQTNKQTNKADSYTPFFA